MTFSFKKQLPGMGKPVLTSILSHIRLATIPTFHFSVSKMSVKQVSVHRPALNQISPEILMNSFSSDSS